MNSYLKNSENLRLDWLKYILSILNMSLLDIQAIVRTNHLVASQSDGIYIYICTVNLVTRMEY